MKTRISEYLLYRKRYLLGFMFVFVLLGIIITIAGGHVPGALRAAELQSALQSGALSVKSMSPATVVDLPYHILQRFSFMLFGVTTLSIKLPSIIIGGLTVIGIYLLIRSWFRRNVAVIVAVIATTTVQFLFVLQDGTPLIMFSFLTVWLLTVATYITRGQIFSTLWKVLAGVLMATALYTPLGIYPVLAMFITASFPPHIRYVLRHISRLRIILALILGLASVVPLVYASILDPTTPLTLL